MDGLMGGLVFDMDRSSHTTFSEDDLSVGWYKDSKRQALSFRTAQSQCNVDCNMAKGKDR